MMEHKGYMAQAVFDAEGELFHGEAIGLNDVVTFEGRTVDELMQAFRDSVDDGLSFCRDLGREQERAYRGELLMRVGPEVHGKTALSAAHAGATIDAWAADHLAAAAETELQEH